MNRHVLLDVYLGLRADALRGVTAAIAQASAAGAADAAIRKPGRENPRPAPRNHLPDAKSGPSPRTLS